MSSPRARAASLAFALVLFVVVGAAAAWLAAHEGHDTVQRPAYKQVRVGSSEYRIGFAAVPQDPLVGEDVRFEFRILRGSGEGSIPSAQQAIAPTDPQVEIVPIDAARPAAARVVPGEKPGTYIARYRFPESGEYGISTRAGAGPDTVVAQFPLLVRGGPVALTPIVVDGILLVVLGALAVSTWRAPRTRHGRSPSHLAVMFSGCAAILVAAHLWVGPRLGRLFLPERHVGSVGWDVATATDTAPEPAPHSHPEGTPPHSHSDENRRQAFTDPAAAPHTPGAGVPAEIASTVVPVPGQLVDVIVPMTARVLFESFVPRMGRTVRRGQTIAVLEHHYVQHDANHLINERWPFLLRALETRRAALAADLNLARVRHLDETGEPAVHEMMRVMQAVPQAERDAAEAQMNRERAEKLIAMHDAQIRKSNLVRRPITSPIDGTIDAVHFTQGQLKYENDKLFTVLDLSRVWIEARFPEQFASSPVPRQMTFLSPAYPGTLFEGRLARVANALDPSTRTLSAFFEVPNAKRLLRVGMRLAGRQSARTVPSPTANDTSARPVAMRVVDPLATPALSLAASVKAQPELTADLTAPLWGRIEFAGRRLTVGDRVRKGEDLLRLVLELSVDERYPMESRALDIGSERDLAKARLQQAERQYQQAVSLLGDDPGDQFRREEVELTERIFREAEAQEALLARQVEAFRGVMTRRDPRITVIQAPISGVITEVGFRPGELNRTGEFRRLLTIVDPSRVWLEAEVYEHQSAAILSGFAHASFTSPGLSSPRPLGRPVAVSGALDPDTGTLKVVFDVPNPGGALKIGASARIAVSRN